LVSITITIRVELIKFALSIDRLKNVHASRHAASACQISIRVIIACTLILIESHIIVCDIFAVDRSETITYESC
jgi:hypothetical protein